jgi:hypothetical protein
MSIGTRKSCLMRKNRVKKSRDTVPIKEFHAKLRNLLVKSKMGSNSRDNSAYTSCLQESSTNSTYFIVKRLRIY